MIPIATLLDMGIENPKIGMEIPIDYFLNGSDENENTQEVFILSGYFKEFVTARAKNFGYIAVSEEFRAKNGAGLISTSIQYTNSSKVDEYNQKLTNDLSLSSEQQINPWRPFSGGGASNMLGFAIFIAFIMFTGYLLIYNVLYISISKDIRFYGLLKAIGTTPRQIKKIVISQTLMLSGIGIPLGLLSGALLSFVLVPVVLGGTVLEIQGKVSFNPLIFIGAALFALMTVFISAIKPSSKASKISPLKRCDIPMQPLTVKRQIQRPAGKFILWQCAICLEIKNAHLLYFCHYSWELPFLW